MWNTPAPEREGDAGHDGRSRAGRDHQRHRRRLQRRGLQLRLRRRGAVLRQRRAGAPLRLRAGRPFLARGQGLPGGGLRPARHRQVRPARRRLALDHRALRRGDGDRAHSPRARPRPLLRPVLGHLARPGMGAGLPRELQDDHPCQRGGRHPASGERAAPAAPRPRPRDRGDDAAPRGGRHHRPPHLPGRDHHPQLPPRLPARHVAAARHALARRLEHGAPTRRSRAPTSSATPAASRTRTGCPSCIASTSRRWCSAASTTS